MSIFSGQDFATPEDDTTSLQDDTDDDRMTNAVSFFVLDVILSKVLLVLLLVTFSGTNGAIQTGLSLALAVLRGALIYVYLPFNAMLSNVRELVTASSHVVIFAMPLLAMYTPLVNALIVSGCPPKIACAALGVASAVMGCCSPYGP